MGTPGEEEGEIEPGVRQTGTWHQDEDGHVLSCTFTRMTTTRVRGRDGICVADRLLQEPATLQIRRASTSIPLNVAEACGKTSQADRARF